MGSTASTTFQDGIEAKLLTSVSTSTTTGVTMKIKQINGVTPTAPTAAHRLHVLQRTALVNKHEIWGVAAGTTQSGQTVTLGTLTRALPLSDGTDFTGSGTAQSFAAGADVILAWDAHDAALTVKKDLANTFTTTQTFSGGITLSGTTKTLTFPSMTTAQRDAVSPVTNGMVIYNTDTGVLNQYVGGAWTTFASGTTVLAANNTAGKVDVATVAEIAAATATDASSGGLNALVVGNTAVNAASGNWASGAIPALNTAKLVDGSLGGTGVASPVLGALLIGGGAGVAMTAIGPGTSGQVPVSNGTTLAMGTAGVYSKVVYCSGTSSSANTGTSGSGTAFDTHTYTIPANDLVNGVCYHIEGSITNSALSGGAVIHLWLAAADLCKSTSIGSASGAGHFSANIWGTTTAGSSASVKGDVAYNYNGAGAGGAATVSEATNGTLAIQIAHEFGGSGSAILNSLTITRLSTTIS